MKRVLIAFLVAGLLAAGQFPAVASADVEFASGIASGDVTARTAVLWTRVDRKALLFAQVARDAEFRQTVRFVPVFARPETDFTVKAVVRRLRPATSYFYRFVHFSFDAPFYRKEVSATGTFRTAPAPHHSADVRFAFSGDSDFRRRPFEVLGAVRDEDPDFFVYLGDTIYADDESPGVPPVTEVPLEESLAVYRDKYREPLGTIPAADISRASVTGSKLRL